MSRLFLVFAFTPLAFAEEPKKAEPVVATVETTLKTSGGQIRQFAFDGDPSTFFASDGKPTKDDHFTLVFDKPVSLKRLELQTGRPKGEDALTSGRVELSSDGKSFKEFANLKDDPTLKGLKSKLPAEVKAIRIVPGDLSHVLVIREFKIDSDPPVAMFKYPVEISVDVSDAPEMLEWAEKTARVCERAYPMINDLLKSDGFKPASLVSMTLKKDYKGVAECAGSRITGSVKYFKDHQEDIGAMVHETVHVVQRYRTQK